MKNLKNITLLLSLVAMLFTACIKDEALNQEADILSMNLDMDILEKEPIISNDEIICYVKPGTDLSSLSPTFEITEGATMMPESGTERDFRTPQIYTVKSQDEKYQKEYTVNFISLDISEKFHFDNFELKSNSYHQLYELDENGEKSLAWASGNNGYSWVAGSATPEEYPTSMSEDGFEKNCAKLTTCSTGFLGAGYGTPIASGNLFMGEFKTNISEPLKSTLFGVPLRHKPLFLKGHYKYKSGDEYKLKSGDVLDRRDSCDIYAVVFEVDLDTKHLDGTNILTHPNIVSIARLDKPKETDTWTPFKIDFITQPGKTFDEEKLKEGKYNFTIVFTSSKEGNLYNGAVGSTLYVDEVELIVR